MRTFERVYDLTANHTWYMLEPGTCKDSVISAYSTEDSVISASGTLGTRENSVVSASGTLGTTLGTREDSVISGFNPRDSRGLSHFSFEYPSDSRELSHFRLRYLSLIHI